VIFVNIGAWLVCALVADFTIPAHTPGMYVAVLVLMTWAGIIGWFCYRDENKENIPKSEWDADYNPCATCGDKEYGYCPTCNWN